MNQFKKVIASDKVEQVAISIESHPEVGSEDKTTADPADIEKNLVSKPVEPEDNNNQTNLHESCIADADETNNNTTKTYTSSALPESSNQSCKDKTDQREEESLVTKHSEIVGDIIKDDVIAAGKSIVPQITIETAESKQSSEGSSDNQDDKQVATEQTLTLESIKAAKTEDSNQLCTGSTDKTENEQSEINQSAMVVDVTVDVLATESPDVPTILTETEGSNGTYTEFTEKREQEPLVTEPSAIVVETEEDAPTTDHEISAEADGSKLSCTELTDKADIIPYATKNSAIVVDVKEDASVITECQNVPDFSTEAGRNQESCTAIAVSEPPAMVEGDEVIAESHSVPETSPKTEDNEESSTGLTAVKEAASSAAELPEIVADVREDVIVTECSDAPRIPSETESSNNPPTQVTAQIEEEMSAAKTSTIVTDDITGAETTDSQNIHQISAETEVSKQSCPEEAGKEERELSATEFSAIVVEDKGNDIIKESPIVPSVPTDAEDSQQSANEAKDVEIDNQTKSLTEVALKDADAEMPDIKENSSGANSSTQSKIDKQGEDLSEALGDQANDANNAEGGENLRSTDLTQDSNVSELNLTDQETDQLLVQPLTTSTTQQIDFEATDDKQEASDQTQQVASMDGEESLENNLSPPETVTDEFLKGGESTTVNLQGVVEEPSAKNTEDKDLLHPTNEQNQEKDIQKTSVISQPCQEDSKEESTQDSVEPKMGQESEKDQDIGDLDTPLVIAESDKPSGEPMKTNEIDNTPSSESDKGFTLTEETEKTVTIKDNAEEAEQVLAEIPKSMPTSADEQQSTDSKNPDALLLDVNTEVLNVNSTPGEAEDTALDKETKPDPQAKELNIESQETLVDVKDQDNTKEVCDEFQDALESVASKEGSLERFEDAKEVEALEFHEVDVVVPQVAVVTKCTQISAKDSGDLISFNENVDEGIESLNDGKEDVSAGHGEVPSTDESVQNSTVNGQKEVVTTNGVKRDLNENDATHDDNVENQAVTTKDELDSNLETGEQVAVSLENNEEFKTSIPKGAFADEDQQIQKTKDEEIITDVVPDKEQPKDDLINVAPKVPEVLVEEDENDSDEPTAEQKVLSIMLDRSTFLHESKHHIFKGYWVFRLWCFDSTESTVLFLAFEINNCSNLHLKIALFLPNFLCRSQPWVKLHRKTTQSRNHKAIVMSRRLTKPSPLPAVVTYLRRFEVT